jgi:hypothetical protein
MNIVLPPIPSSRVIERIGKDAMRVAIPPCVLTREEAFRLIGELERLASTL